MAITDIDISETLETNAPSIKYRGNEGPKSPQEEQMIMEQQQMAAVDPMMQKKLKLIEELMGQGYDFGSASNLADKILSGQDEQDIGMASGGIAGLDGRVRYGLGSSLKKRLRKLIPNEVAKVAEVAAPFVAPFNPLAAGLMSGIGGFDRHGSISQGLKSGLMNYGMGNVARYVGGAGPQWGLSNPNAAANAGFMESYLSSPIGTDTGLGKWLDSRKTTPVDGSNMTQKDVMFGETADTSGITSRGGEITADNFLNKRSEVLNTTKERLNLLDKFKQLPGQLKNKIQAAGISPTAMMGILGASAAAGIYTGMTQEDEVLSGLDRGEGMDIAGIRAEVTEAMKDPSGELLKALRVKYPFLGTQGSKNTAIMANGGRIGRAEGGLMDLGGMEKDYRAEGGFVPIGKEEKADDVPARLSVNEFVFTADAVRNAGGGDIDKGAEVMENMMKHLEQGGQVSEESQGMQGARDMFATSERLSEVVA